MSNRTDWPELTIEIMADRNKFNRIETELHNAYIAGYETCQAEMKQSITINMPPAPEAILELVNNVRQENERLRAEVARLLTINRYR